MCGCVGVWVCGCVGVGVVCGCVGVWGCGCVGVWGWGVGVRGWVGRRMFVYAHAYNQTNQSFRVHD